MGALASSTAVVAVAPGAALADPSAAAARARALTSGRRRPTRVFFLELRLVNLLPRSTALRARAVPSFAAAMAAWTRLACSSWSVFTKRPMCTTSVISNGLAGGVVSVRAVGKLHPGMEPEPTTGCEHLCALHLRAQREPANVHFAEGEAEHGGPLGQLADHGCQLKRVLQQRLAPENVQAQSAVRVRKCQIRKKKTSMRRF